MGSRELPTIVLVERDFLDDSCALLERADVPPLPHDAEHLSRVFKSGNRAAVKGGERWVFNAGGDLVKYFRFKPALDGRCPWSHAYLSGTVSHGPS